MADSQRPGLTLFLSEPGRAVADYCALVAASPLLLTSARGDGHCVLVLPGFLAEDFSTTTLRLFLRARGYDVTGWRLGRNIGPTAAILNGMAPLLNEVAERGGRPVSIVGWSLGGIFARELARSHPTLVRQVITLGSPFRLADSRDSRAHAAFQRLSRLHVDATSMSRRRGLAKPIPVPSTSIYSKFDGIVPWQACLEGPATHAENVAVYGSHLGLGHNAAALWVVADRLAQPVGVWRPFRPPAVARLLFPPAGGVLAA